MEDAPAAIAVMDRLHACGIRMSIDDFGTGYSSLSYLKRFKGYYQSFVLDISKDLEDRAIVVAIISLANSLGLQTIAEGVETEGQLAFLREQGCNEVQSYYFSKPLPADEFLMFAGAGCSGAGCRDGCRSGTNDLFKLDDVAVWGRTRMLYGVGHDCFPVSGRS